MRLWAYWWGIVLIPETIEEHQALLQVPAGAERCYEEGTAVWATPERIDEMVKGTELVRPPLGLALEISR